MLRRGISGLLGSVMVLLSSAVAWADVAPNKGCELGAPGGSMAWLAAVAGVAALIGLRRHSR